MRCRLICLLACLVALSATAVFADVKKLKGPPSSDRVEQIAKILPKAPRGVCPKCSDRQAWQKIAPLYKGLVRRASRLMTKPVPVVTDEIFLEYSKTGNRRRCDRLGHRRCARLSILTIAECVENKGRFVPAIEESIRSLCAARTWLSSAHDRKLRNFNGQVIEIDLGAATVGWELAIAYDCLGDKLSPDVRRLIRGEIERRILVPFEGMVKTGKPRMWWLNTTSNWNAVCLAGVVGTGLTMIEDRERRAFFVASAEKYIQNFLSGFPEDGYCTEGLGYWNYGFGRFVRLAETVRRATGGQFDMFDDPHVAKVARFGRNLEILPGVFPAFADCSSTARPSSWLMAFVNCRFQLGGGEGSAQYIERSYNGLCDVGLFSFGDVSNSKNAKQAVEPLPLRSWFSDGGVLICRPGEDKQGAIGVALKGGHNAEHHNHNDVGSFVVALDNKIPILDPGNEIYTGRTFSRRRYESNVLNSFGHGVPKVAGQLQCKGREAAAKVLETQFTDKQDTLAMDISDAYVAKGLKKLHRTFVYSREGTGKLTVIDEVEFDKPNDFETALITFSKWRRTGPNSLIIGEGDSAVKVDISTGGVPFEVKAEEIREDLPKGRIPTRIGIRLKNPAKKAIVTTIISASKK